MNSKAAVVLLIALAACDTERAPQVKTGPVATVEDSILDTMLPDRIAVTSSGDTLHDQGGGMISERYGLSYYKKNGEAYFRIQESMGHRPDGRAIWRFITRVNASRLDFAEELLFAGLCGTNAESDPTVVAIARVVPLDTAFTAIRRAWKFDSASRTVMEISTKDVKCWSPGGD